MRMPYNETAEILPPPVPARPGRSFPGRIRAAREEMAMSGLEGVTGEPLVRLKHGRLHTSARVSPPC